MFNRQVLETVRSFIFGAVVGGGSAFLLSFKYRRPTMVRLNHKDRIDGRRNIMCLHQPTEVRSLVLVDLRAVDEQGYG